MKELEPEIVVSTHQLKTYLGGNWVHQGVNLAIKRGEIVAIVGGSGTGKSVLLRELLHLLPATAGSIKIFGEPLENIASIKLQAIQRRWGVMFQHSALFSSLTVLENIAFPLQEHVQLDPDTINELAMIKLLEAGLSAKAANKYPAELSGGMEKRAALARANVLDPELLFLDEPTAGLDPTSAAAFDELVLNLRETLGLTIIMVTHDLDSLWRVTDRVAFLGEGKVLELAPMQELIHNPHPLIQNYFNGPRGRVAQGLYQKKVDPKSVNPSASE